MQATASAPPDRLEKFLAIRRSNAVPTLYWWSLPLPLTRLEALFDAGRAGERLAVHPATALGPHAPALGAHPIGGNAALLDDVRRAFALRAEGRIGPCTMALFPPGIRAADLEARLSGFRTALERLPFTLAFRSTGSDAARHEFCFRVPGQAIRALEDLALGRSFGGNPGQVEMALLQGLALRPRRRANLRLVLQAGGARLVRGEAFGRGHTVYLESGKGFTGVTERIALDQALRAEARERRRRFPVGVVMFAGLPFFIVAFWTANRFAKWAQGGVPWRRKVSSSGSPAERSAVR